MTASLQDIRERLGGALMAGGERWLGPGPGHSRRDRSLSVAVGEGGRLLIYSFAGDDFRACADHLGLDREAVGTAPAPAPASRRKAPPEPDPRAMKIWGEARPRGEIVESYLASRAIVLPTPPTLRQGVGPALGRTPVPTMVAAVQAPDRRVIAVQTLRLTWDGRKAPISIARITTGKLHDGAVRLAAAAEVMGLAEGVETALSAMQLAGVPVWATLGAERLPLAWLPPAVRELHIFADADDAGQRAAEKTAARWTARGVAVIVRTPADSFGDWNDALAAREPTVA